MISIKNIEKSYGTKEAPVKVLKGISFDIKDKDFVVILGASGSGKSTLLNIISGIERADKGMVLYDNLDITELTDNELTAFRKDNTGFVFQQYYLLSNMNVDRNVKMCSEMAGNRDYI